MLDAEDAEHNYSEGKTVKVGNKTQTMTGTTSDRQVWQ